jgi:long-chain acyl-CoA synthetase
MTVSASPSVDTVPAVLARRVASSPDAVAFQTETAPGQWSPTTWSEFAERGERLRRALHAVGLRPGDRLAIIAPVSLEWELLHHAALSLGLVVAGMDGHDLPERIAGMVELADITAFAVSSPSILARLSAQRWSSCRLALDLRPTGEAWPVGASPITWDALAAVGTPPHRRLPAPDPQDHATIIFTSGTTGEPKAIAYRHEQVCLAVQAIGDAFPFVGPGSRLLCWLPLSNLFQRMVNLAAMSRGAATYLLSDPRRVMDAVGGVSPDIFVGVPRFYEKLYDGALARVQALPGWQRRLVALAWNVGRRSSPYRQNGRAMPLGLRLGWALADRAVLRRLRSVMGDRLRYMVTGSAPMPRHLLGEFHALGWTVLEAYGMSENIVPIAMNRPDHFRFGSVGTVMPGNEIAVTSDGEVKVRGAGVLTGYVGTAHAATFDTDGYYATGDLGAIDEEGFLSLCGRRSEILKTSTGRRVAPGPVEAVLRQAQGLDHVVVVGEGRKQLAAIATLTTPLADAKSSRQLGERIHRQLEKLAPQDRPMILIVTDHAFSVETGELTPNMEPRRKQIEDKFASALNREFHQLATGSSVSMGRATIVWNLQTELRGPRQVERP